MNQLSPEQFIKKYQGKTISGWSNSGGQCVDAVRQVMRETMGISGTTLQAISGGNAHDFFNNASTKYFHKTSGGYVRRTPNLIVPEWAIVVLNHGFYGHVFMSFKGSTHNLIRGWGQNWTRVRHCDYEAHGLSEVIGILTRL